jgi:Patatin-like phospholipase
MKDKNAERPKPLYEILLTEYEKLGILSKEEIAVIRNEVKKPDDYDENNAEQRQRFGAEMMRKIRGEIHRKVKENKDTKPFAALCLSGGGIRSATFNLGILQGLARHNLLDKFHYLSSVSGGGYIASWLSAWIYRKRLKAQEAGYTPSDENFSAEFASHVQKDLSPEHVKEVEPLEISHLRAYSNYMSPRPGLFTVDTWTLVAVYLRNLLLNWTVFLPLIAALLLLPRMFFAVLAKTHDYMPNYYEKFSGEEVLILILSFLGGSIGIGCMIAMRPTLREYFWSDAGDKTEPESTTGESRFLSFCTWLVIFLGFGVTVFWVWYKIEAGAGLPPFLYFVIFGAGIFIAGLLFALIFAIVAHFEKPKIKETLEEKKEKSDRKVYWWAEIPISLVSGAIGGAMLYLVYKILESSGSGIYFYLVYASYGIPLFLIVFLLTAVIYVGSASKVTDDMDREWLSRFGGVLLIAAVSWSLASSIVLFGPMFLGWLKTTIMGQTIAGLVGAISGAITLFLGFGDNGGGNDEKEPKSKTSFLLWFAPQVAAPIFAAFLLVLVTYGTYLLMNLVAQYVSFLSFNQLTNTDFTYPGFRVTLIWFVVLAVLGGLMGWFVNVNKFSLHATYRERLIRAYLGASRAKDRLKTANFFTGLDNLDNVEMKELTQKPFHVVNMTLNLAKSNDLRWQNRKAESFTSTALHSGSSNMDNGNGSYRTSNEYGWNAQNGKAISLGTAAAISGAAASPNMGYYTSSFAVSFLMALFNVRLGWWLGNPGETGANTYKLSAPRFAPKVFFSEALGMTDDRHKYVYLSDGGHFDNLGLYEMVLRRCHLILVCDSGADAEFGFGDFGTAIHKIRVDMGIPIEFKNREAAPTPGRNCGIAEIKYQAVDGNDAENGVLIYVKPTLDGDEPIDIINYKTRYPDFPHESTADQMYSETQFESYRKLGSHMINSFCCTDAKMPCGKCQQLSNLEKNARRYLKKFKEKKSKDGTTISAD